MTVWEHLVFNSTLAEADGDAWEHLIYPNGEGGGGDIIINSELVLIEECPIIKVSEHSDTVSIEDTSPILIQVEEDIILISEVEIGEIDVVC